MARWIVDRNGVLFRGTMSRHVSIIKEMKCESKARHGNAGLLYHSNWLDHVEIMQLLVIRSACHRGYLYPDKPASAIIIVDVFNYIVYSQ